MTILGFLIGLGITWAVVTLWRRTHRPPSALCQEAFLAMRRELDEARDQAQMIGDEVVVLRARALRAPELDAVLRNLEAYRYDVGQALASSAQSVTDDRRSMLLALERALHHSETIVVSTRSYQPRVRP